MMSLSKHSGYVTSNFVVLRKRVEYGQGYSLGYLWTSNAKHVGCRNACSPCHLGYYWSYTACSKVREIMGEILGIISLTFVMLLIASDLRDMVKDNEARIKVLEVQCGGK